MLLLSVCSEVCALKSVDGVAEPHNDLHTMVHMRRTWPSRWTDVYYWAYSEMLLGCAAYNIVYMKWLAICVREVIRLTRALRYQRVFRTGRMGPIKRVAGRAIVVCAMHRLWHILTYELHSHAHGEGVVCVHWVVFANRHEVAGLLFSYIWWW